MYPAPSNPQRRPDFGPGCLIAGALASSLLAGKCVGGKVTLV